MGTSHKSWEPWTKCAELILLFVPSVFPIPTHPFVPLCSPAWQCCESQLFFPQTMGIPQSWDTSSFLGPPRQLEKDNQQICLIAGCKYCIFENFYLTEGRIISGMRSRLKESWNVEQLKQMMLRKVSSDSRFYMHKLWAAISIRNIILGLFSTPLPLVSLLYPCTPVIVGQSEPPAVIPQRLTFIIQVTTQSSCELQRSSKCV